MASSWSNSWGNAWGDSWGQTQEQVTLAGGYPSFPLEKLRREDEEILTVLYAFIVMRNDNE